MTNYVFKPGNKQGRNKYVGSWSEKASKKIEMPYTVESMRLVLGWGAAPDGSAFSHQDIAHWCDRFHMAMFDVETDHLLDVATGIAADVDVQWDLFLANTYSLEQLKELDFGAITLPMEWFDDWQKQLSDA
jgi:hypothetical protein